MPAGDKVGPIDGNPANRDYAKALQEWPKVAPGRVTRLALGAGCSATEWPTIFYLADNDEVLAGLRSVRHESADLQRQLEVAVLLGVSQAGVESRRPTRTR